MYGEHVDVVSKKLDKRFTALIESTDALKTTLMNEPRV
jgi:hypothetical protein